MIDEVDETGAELDGGGHDHNPSFWEVNRNRDHKDWLPETKEDFDKQIAGVTEARDAVLNVTEQTIESNKRLKKLEDKLELLKNLYEHYNK